MTKDDERSLPQQLVSRAEALRWLLFDVDGVLTDGRLLYTGEGETLKQFDVKDGLGLKLAQRRGLRVGVLSGRRSAPLQTRLEDLGLDERILSRSDKAQAFDELLERHDLQACQVAYVGDDLLDLPVLLRCGLSFAPADAVEEVRQRVDVVLTAPGGHGAGRELVERVLRARGDWQRTVDRFLGS